jgi:hypothetical protein
MSTAVSTAPGPSRRSPTQTLLWVLVVLALGLAAVSLAINLWMLGQLLAARRQVAAAAGQAADVVSGLGTAALDYTVHVDEAIPFSTEVIVSDTIQVPIDAVIPIDTEVIVPVNTPLGSFDITLPVKATVPVSMAVSVPIRTRVPVSAVVPVALDVPIHIELKSTPLGRALGEVSDALDTFSRDWQTDPWPWAGR